MEASDIDPAKLKDEMKKQEEWAKAIIFDETCAVVAEMNCPAKKEELASYLKAVDSRDNTVGAGFTLLNQHYDVHRFHPPLVYGRRGNADEGEGICLCRGKSKKGKTLYMIITYMLPIVSARAIPQQIKFYNTHIGELDKF